MTAVVVALNQTCSGTVHNVILIYGNQRMLDGTRCDRRIGGMKTGNRCHMAVMAELDYLKEPVAKLFITVKSKLADFG